jgi:Na+/proline symporter
MIRTLLPVGLAGLCLAGLAAASMSTIDSSLCAISSLFAFDVWKKLRPASSERHLVAVGRVAVGAGLAIGILWAPSIRTFGVGMFLYLIAAMTFVTPGIIVCFLAGVFWRGARTSGAWASLLTGVPLGVALFVVKVRTGRPLFGVADLYVSLGLIGISAAAMAIGSALARGPAREREATLYFVRGALAEEAALPLLRRSSTWLAVLAAAILALYWAFR